MLERFKVDYGHALQIDTFRLSSHEFEGDLELYLAGLESILMGMHQQPDPHWLHSIVERNLRRCKALSPEFVFYDRADPGDPERTTEWLLQMARRAVSRKQLQDTQAGMTAAISTKKVAVTKKAPAQKAPKTPPAQPQRSAQPAAGAGDQGVVLPLATPPRPQGPPPKAAKATASRPTPHSVNMQCVWFVKDGNCKFGDKCIYKHDANAPPSTYGSGKVCMQALEEELLYSRQSVPLVS